MNQGDIFKCTQCGDCCKGYGGTVVTKSDIVAIAGYIKTDIQGFREKCCRPSGDKFMLAQGDDGYCFFWDRTCTIHPVKPKMCREWPYLRSVLIDKDNWRVMAGCCPGIQADAPDQVISAIVTEALKNRGEMGSDTVD